MKNQLIKHKKNASIVYNAIKKVERTKMNGITLAWAISEAKQQCNLFSFDYELFYGSSRTYGHAAFLDLQTAIQSLIK